MNIAVYDLTGKQVDNLNFELPDIKLSDYELAQIIRAYETNLHQGTKKAKTKGEVNYSKRKPFRQKGTGRARAGQRGSPIWVGGGVAHGPKPHMVRLKINKKQKIRALVYMLNLLADKNKIIALDPGQVDKPLTTKQGIGFLRTVGLLPFKLTYVPTVRDNFTVTGFRNIPSVLIRRAELISAYDLFRGRPVIFTVEGIKTIKSRILKDENI